MQVVTAQPIRSARIAWVSSAIVLAAFVFTAVVMKRYNAGAAFTGKDQVGTVVVGIVLAALLIMPTRPRLVADQESVRLRSFLGGWRVVPWDVIVAVRFPSTVRFAQLVLPGEETLAIYAIQRLDKQYAVAKMQQLRELYAVARSVDG